MKKIDYKTLEIKPHHIIIAITSEPDYEMERKILLQFNYGTFIILEGYHCSCYDFDDTEWEAIEYTEEELSKLANAEYNKDNIFWQQVKIHVV
jgi:hypothetical protein